MQALDKNMRVELGRLYATGDGGNELNPRKAYELWKPVKDMLSGADLEMFQLFSGLSGEKTAVISDFSANDAKRYEINCAYSYETEKPDLNKQLKKNQVARNENEIFERNKNLYFGFNFWTMTNLMALEISGKKSSLAGMIRKTFLDLTGYEAQETSKYDYLSNGTNSYNSIVRSFYGVKTDMFALMVVHVMKEAITARMNELQAKCQPGDKLSAMINGARKSVETLCIAKMEYSFDRFVEIYKPLFRFFKYISADKFEGIFETWDRLQNKMITDNKNQVLFF